MSYFTGFYPSVRADSSGDGVVSQAGGVVLTSMVKVAGLGAGLSEALEPWRKPFATHDPGKILTDPALSLATGGDSVSDIDRLRNEPEVYGLVASDPTIKPAVQDPGNGKACQGAGGHQRRPCQGPGPFVGAGREGLAPARGERGQPSCHRLGCVVAEFPFRVGRCPSNVEEGLRVPPIVFLSGSRHSRHR